MRWRQSEAQWQATVMDLARLMGVRRWHHHDSRREVRPGVHVGDVEAAGWPDLFLIDPARRLAWAWECKTQTGRLTLAQAEALQLLTDAGIPARVIRPNDWSYVEAVLRRRQLP